MSRTATATLSTENLLHNLSVLQKAAQPAQIIAMIKANAYGHGLRSVAQRLDSSVALFGVASIDEALALRKIGIQSPILLMEGVFHADELPLAAQNHCHVVFHEPTQIEWLKKLKPLEHPFHAWLKIDSGMGRLGFSMSSAVTAYEQLMACPQTKNFIPILSHFACADQIEHPLNMTQIQNIELLLKQFKTKFSFCNSAAIFNYPKYHSDYVRPGLAMYGASPMADVASASALHLKPVMTLQSSLIAKKILPKNSSIGYGANFILKKDTPIGIIAFGYGDGYPFSQHLNTPVLIQGQECPIVGRVSMDMMAVDLSTVPHAQVGDPVTLWGEGLPIERIASAAKTTPWVLLTQIQNRVKFTWT